MRARIHNQDHFIAKLWLKLNHNLVFLMIPSIRNKFTLLKERLSLNTPIKKFISYSMNNRTYFTRKNYLIEYFPINRRIDQFEEKLSVSLHQVMESMKLLISQSSVKCTDQMTMNSSDQYSCLCCDKNHSEEIVLQKDTQRYPPPLSRTQSLQCSTYPLSTNKTPLRNTKSLMETMYEVSAPHMIADSNEDTLEMSNDSIDLDNTLEYVSSLENTLDANTLLKQSEPLLNRALSLQSCSCIPTTDYARSLRCTTSLTDTIPSVASSALEPLIISSPIMNKLNEDKKRSSLSESNIVSVQSHKESQYSLTNLYSNV